jgi:hypothetical protein
MLFTLVVGFVLILLAEVPVLVSAGMWRELRAFGVMLTMGFFFCLAVALKWPVPNPNAILRTIFDPVATFIGIQ